MGVFRFFFYPIIKAGEQFKSSAKGVAASTDAARDKFNRLTVRGEVKNPSERFEELVEEHGWDDKGLAEQLLASRRTKYFAMGSTVLALMLVLILMTQVPAYLAILLVPAGVFALALGLVMTLKFTLFQEQLRRRSLITLKVIMTESGFWGYVFR